MLISVNLSLGCRIGRSDDNILISSIRFNIFSSLICIISVTNLDISIISILSSSANGFGRHHLPFRHIIRHSDNFGHMEVISFTGPNLSSLLGHLLFFRCVFGHISTRINRNTSDFGCRDVGIGGIGGQFTGCRGPIITHFGLSNIFRNIIILGFLKGG